MRRAISRLSVPFSSGLVVQRPGGRRCAGQLVAFSPLFVGSGGATPRRHQRRPRAGRAFSPLFVGSGGATGHGHDCPGGANSSFSPLFVGSGGATTACPSGSCLRCALSVPFSSGLVVQLISRTNLTGSFLYFQSPFRRVWWCNGPGEVAGPARRAHFQSPFRRVWWCNSFLILQVSYPTELSVPFSSGLVVQLWRCV